MKKRDQLGRRNNTINHNFAFTHHANPEAPSYSYPEPYPVRRRHPVYPDPLSRRYSHRTPSHTFTNSSTSTSRDQPVYNSSVITSTVDHTNGSSSNSNSDTFVLTGSPKHREHKPTHTPAISDISLHTRNLSTISAISFSTDIQSPQRNHTRDHWLASPKPFKHFFSERSSPKQHQHPRHPSFDPSEFSPFPYYPKLSPKPSRLSKLKHPLLSASTASEDKEANSTFPNSAIRSPDRTRRREKNVSVSFLEYPLETSYFESRDPFEKIPLVSPSRRGLHYKMQESSHQSTERVKEEIRDHSIVSNHRKHIISSGSNGVEVALKNESGPYSMLVRSDQSNENNMAKKDSNDSNKNDTPPRESTGEKGKKVTVITPQEGQNHGHTRSPSYNTVDFHNELPSVPDSPYSPFPGHHPGYSYQTSHPPSFPQGFPSPNKATAKSPKRERASEDPPYPYSPHYGYHYPPPSHEENYREMSPGKRQRVGAAEAMDNDQYASKEGYANNPEAEHYNQESYYRYFNRPGARDFYSESFDSESAGFDRTKYPPTAPPPPVTKAPSYPPASPSRWGGGPPESSANSYPGAHSRSQENGGDYPSGPNAYRGPPHRYPYEYHDGYYPEHHRSRYHEMPGSVHHRPPPPGYYYHDAPPPHDEVHPLLRDYDPERDRRQAPPPPRVEDKNGYDKQLSPDRSTKDEESVSTTPSLKSRNSKVTSPTKRKPSTAAKAAIAAGMTQPQAANEIDFDIHSPPLEPVTPPSKEAVCNLTSNVNNDDVLCGRGGGTNTQIGNRKFRALVQEFQPTYLLCRRKEKPLIARTIVLIIRNRGGRFLKKDEVDGMLYEVGDEKAEAKTSQALREGLDVRASKSTTLMGRKHKRAAEKKKQKQAADSTSTYSGPKSTPQTDDLTIAESPMRSQRDPPPQHEYSSMYPPPPYYYGYGGQYPPYHYGYDPNPAYNSPSRKRQRTPHGDSMHYNYPPGPYSHKGYHPPYPYPPEYQNYPPPTMSHNESGEENAMWETDFNPPRGLTKKEDTRVKGEQ